MMDLTDPMLVYEDSGGVANNVTTSVVNDEMSYFWWKLFLLLWDLLGLVVNGLGIDMLWHGVEVNHAVYFVILQDICLAFSTTMASELFNWILWSDDLMWFRFHGFLSLLPFMFHNWAWASVASLR